MNSANENSKPKAPNTNRRALTEQVVFRKDRDVV